MRNSSRSDWEFKPLKYVSETASQILKSKYDLSHSTALSVLAHSLLFDSIEDLHQEYTPDEDGFYNVDSLIFSEFVLAEKLNLNFKEAYKLKEELDYFYCYDSGISAGNIDFANFTMMTNCSYNINQGNGVRIMFRYPVSFYCRILEQTFVLRSGAEYELNSLWCDGFGFDRLEYFINKENAILYARTILEILLTYNHLIISHLVVQNWIKKHNYLYQYVIDNFDCRLAYGTWWSDKIKEYGLYIPKGSKSLETRLDIDNPLIDIIQADRPKMRIGDKIKLLREKMNLTQQELADKSRVTQKSISNWENHRNYPDVQSLLQVCPHICTSLTEFLHNIE